jgi:hypothetical protein
MPALQQRTYDYLGRWTGAEAGHLIPIRMLALQKNLASESFRRHDSTYKAARRLLKVQ